ncbi:MAG: SdiA-regulated domain-containing protein [Chitinophagaceae bacterium]
MMKSPLFLSNILLLPLFLLLSSMLHCQRAPPVLDYDLTKPHVIPLSKPLKEISGIVVSENRVFAISDDKGQLYQLNLDDGKIVNQWTFGEADDYEDVTVVADRFFILNSNGNIVSFTLPQAGSPVIKIFKFPFGKGNEFEILYYDKQNRQLVMVCKECKDDGTGRLSAYTIDPSTGNYQPAPFKINTAAAGLQGTNKPNRLKPSAAAIHPASGEVYMISSINKAMIRMNRNGKVISVHPLKRKVFEQPEGITFTADGNMLISNEAGQKDQATLLQFKHKPN